MADIGELAWGVSCPEARVLGECGSTLRALRCESREALFAGLNKAAVSSPAHKIAPVHEAFFTESSISNLHPKLFKPGKMRWFRSRPSCDRILGESKMVSADLICDRSPS